MTAFSRYVVPDDQLMGDEKREIWRHRKQNTKSCFFSLPVGSEVTNVAD